MTTTRRTTLLLSTVFAAILVGCSGGATPSVRPNPSPAPSVVPPTPLPSPSPAPTTVTSPAQAAALVFGSDPRWAAMTPLRADLIGASMWFEAFISRDGGYAVDITAGSGDCQAGCINQRTWHYFVDADGNVTLESEEGEEVEIGVPRPGNGPSTVQVLLNSGPICPVEQIPPDPNCAERAVANALVTLHAADGTEIATATTGADGTVVFEIEPGAYYVVAEQVEGLMGTPEAQAFSVVGGDTAGLVMSYDTGIR
jgi:hypothetical protein